MLPVSISWQLIISNFSLEIVCMLQRVQKLKTKQNPKQKAHCLILPVTQTARGRTCPTDAASKKEHSTAHRSANGHYTSFCLLLTSQRQQMLAMLKYQLLLQDYAPLSQGFHVLKQ